MRRCRLLLLLCAALAVPACDPAHDDERDLGGKADDPSGAGGLVDGTPLVVGLLRFVNDPSTTERLLDDEVGLASDAAASLVAQRDDDPIDELAELDAVPRIGPAAIERLVAFAVAHDFVPEGDELLGNYDGVSFTVDEARAVVAVVDDASHLELDDTIGLDARAADAIVAARPLATVLALSELPFVGASALEKLLAYVGADSNELAIISDLDKTIVPPAPSGQELPDAAYPGIAALLQILEHDDGRGSAGDLHFVTARQPERVVDIPAWLAEQGVPAGDISTGISGIPSIARAEKVRDISALFDAHPEQRFVLFGDSSHVDPDAYRSIVESYGDRVEVAFIHDVADIDPERVEGLVLVDHYAEAAGELFERGVIDEDQARAVMIAVAAGGEIDAGDVDALLDAYRP